MTGKATHTPGPWAVERCEVTPCYHIEAGAYPFGTSICEIAEGVTNGTAAANARLIAAAPIMLEALKDAEAVLTIVEPRNSKAEYLEVLARVRAAIKATKATGTTP